MIQEKTKTKNHNFSRKLIDQGLDIDPITVETLQVNITKLCNQACTHCHVDASPWRSEQMSIEGVERCLEILSENDCIKNLDLTGGAPELNPHFDYFVREARKSWQTRNGKTQPDRYSRREPPDGRGKNVHTEVFRRKPTSKSYPRFHITAATSRTSRGGKEFSKKA